MKAEVTINEAQIKEAIAAWMNARGHDVKNVRLEAWERLDRRDNHCGYAMHAKVNTEIG